MKILLSLLALITIVCGYVYFNYAPEDITADVPVVEIEVPVDTPLPTTSAPAQIAVFENVDYDFTFKYRIKPYGYLMFENNLQQNIDLGTLFGVTLVRSNDYNESVEAAARGEGRDGPPFIMVYVFSASKVFDLSAWLIDMQRITNCAEGEITNTVLAGNDALVCLWDGLYQGVTIAQIRDNKIYLLSGTRESGETPDGYSYEKDFNEVVESFGVTK